MTVVALVKRILPLWSMIDRNGVEYPGKDIEHALESPQSMHQNKSVDNGIKTPALVGILKPVSSELNLTEYPRTVHIWRVRVH
jgi:hypothetical protein